MALLFHVGRIGTCLYSGGLLWVAYRLAVAARSDALLGAYAKPVLVGLGAFLIGNVTNPYLEKFDSMWVVLLPIALLNVAWFRREAVVGAGLLTTHRAT
jgi:hypothetical protein